jgi:cytochrome b561
VWRNTDETYGLVAIFLHWTMALVVIGLFVLGLWMVDLTYYDPWYRRGPELHKGIGILVFAVLLVRLLWRGMNPVPRPEPGVSGLERKLSQIVHALLYVLLFAIMISGYLISTADGRGIDVFGLFQVPATLKGIPGQADIAGEVHFILAVSTITLAVIHALAAFKHHFVNRDRTLVRMLRARKP